VSGAPSRIQLRRTKGWRLPVGAVVVARPSVFGNPFRVTPALDARSAVRLFELWITGVKPGHEEQRARLLDRIGELRGKALACWCPLGSPCHADVLLKIANGGAS
jgi:hypothetical protein